jgi:hypothetical protein
MNYNRFFAGFCRIGRGQGQIATSAPIAPPLPVSHARAIEALQACWRATTMVSSARLVLRKARGQTMTRISSIGPVAAVALALLASQPAAAQSLGTGIPLNQEEAKTPEQIEKQKKIEDAYKATMQKIPDAKAQNDPWGGMRTSTDSTKPAQAKPKTIAPKKTSVAN